MTQNEALQILKLGYNVFITGGPGTGKTFVLNKFIQYLKVHNIPSAITASTGIAATHINGQTIHSFAGLGIKDNFTDWDLELISQNESLYKKVINIKVLIIDEISMLKASTLNNVNKVFKIIKKNNIPFGGIQIVFCGDFFQLPPVIKRQQEQSFVEMDKNLLREFAFNSESWKQANPVICYLKENFRQEDNTLTNILNMIRNKDENIYDSLQSLYETCDNILDNPIRLYSHNSDVDSINMTHYKAVYHNDHTLDKEYTFIMKEKGKAKYLESLKKSILAQETLKLKVGAKVMFIKNDKSGKYQNGTLGTVSRFDDAGYPVVETKNSNIVVHEEVWQIKDENEKVLAEVEQLPLRYAWAITIHKSQGMTLDEAEIDLSKGFGFGMGYVALSRVRSLSGLRLLGLNNLALSVADPVIVFDKTLKQKSQKARESIHKYSQEEIEQMHKDKINSWGIVTEYYRESEIEEILEQEESKQKSPSDAKFDKKEDTRVITLRLIFQGESLESIAQKRGFKTETILEHIRDIRAMSDNKVIDLGTEETKVNKCLFEYYDKYLQESFPLQENHQDTDLEQSYKLLKIKNKNEYINSRIIKNNSLVSIQKDLLEGIKLSEVLNKYKTKIEGINWHLLRIIRCL